MRKWPSLAILTLCLVWVVFAWCWQTPVQAQTFHADFSGELAFQPIPPSLLATRFGLALGVSVQQASFFSQTGFDLSSFRSQLFSMSVSIGQLLVEDHLLFQPGLTFKRNELLSSISAAGLNLNMEVLLAELGPPSPDINPGLVIEAGGTSSIGAGITSFTSFGVTQTTEDHQTITPCLPDQLSCLGASYPDGVADRLIVKPFAFSEEAVRLDASTNGITLATTPIFTPTGLDRVLVEGDLAVSSPQLTFQSVSTISIPLVLTREQVTFAASMGIVSWRAITLFSGSPLAFTQQTFKLRLATKGVELFVAGVFDIAGVSELRAGAGLTF